MDRGSLSVLAFCFCFCYESLYEVWDVDYIEVFLVDFWKCVKFLVIVWLIVLLFNNISKIGKKLLGKYL